MLTNRNFFKFQIPPLKHLRHHVYYRPHMDRKMEDVKFVIAHIVLAKWMMRGDPWEGIVSEN